jgi:hypothetical protein
VQQALGDQTFRLLLEHLPDSALKGLLKKLDAHHPELKTGGGAWGRKHIVAFREAEPAVKPARASAKKKAAPSQG